MKLAATTALAVLAVTRVAWAHGDVHPRIDAATAQIAAQPRNGPLFLARGLLYEVDEDWRSAARDLQSALDLGAVDDALVFHLARARANAGDPAGAIALLDDDLRAHPSRVDGFLVRARAHAALRHTQEAASDYDTVIARAEPVAPEYFIERARALATAGARDRSLAGLHAGVERLGPLASIVTVAVSIEREGGHTDDALAWISMLPAPLRASAEWRRVEGDIERDAGRPARALRAWRAGIEWIDALPPTRRRAEQWRSVRAELTARIAAVDREASRAIAEKRARTRGWIMAIVAAIALLLAVARRATGRRA